MSTAGLVLGLLCLAGFAIFAARYCIVLQRRRAFRSGFTLKDVPQPQEQEEDTLVSLVALEAEEFDLDHD